MSDEMGKARLDELRSVLEDMTGRTLKKAEVLKAVDVSSGMCRKHGGWLLVTPNRLTMAAEHFGVDTPTLMERMGQTFVAEVHSRFWGHRHEDDAPNYTADEPTL